MNHLQELIATFKLMIKRQSWSMKGFALSLTKLAIFMGLELLWVLFGPKFDSAKFPGDPIPYILSIFVSVPVWMLLRIVCLPVWEYWNDEWKKAKREFIYQKDSFSAG